jgi:hypothetical protein
MGLSSTDGRTPYIATCYHRITLPLMVLMLYVHYNVPMKLLVLLNSSCATSIVYVDTTMQVAIAEKKNASS